MIDELIKPFAVGDRVACILSGEEVFMITTVLSVGKKHLTVKDVRDGSAFKFSLDGSRRIGSDSWEIFHIEHLTQAHCDSFRRRKFLSRINRVELSDWKKLSTDQLEKIWLMVMVRKKR